MATTDPPLSSVSVWPAKETSETSPEYTIRSLDPKPEITGMKAFRLFSELYERVSTPYSPAKFMVLADCFPTASTIKVALASIWTTPFPINPVPEPSRDRASPAPTSINPLLTMIGAETVPPSISVCPASTVNIPAAGPELDPISIEEEASTENVSLPPGIVATFANRMIPPLDAWT